MDCSLLDSLCLYSYHLPLLVVLNTVNTSNLKTESFFAVELFQHLKVAPLHKCFKELLWQRLLLHIPLIWSVFHPSHETRGTTHERTYLRTLARTTTQSRSSKSLALGDVGGYGPFEICKK